MSADAHVTETSVHAPSVALPVTARNIAVGAGWTMLIFVAVISAVTGLLTGAVGYVFALFISGFVTVVSTPVLGIPLSLLASRLLRRVPTIAAHLTGQFLAGAIAATVVVSLYLWLDSSTIEGWSAVAVAAIVAIAGGSSMAGWLLAHRAQPSA